MDKIGLYYYVARWYDPYLNHFIQADTIVPQPGMSVAYDRYAYVQWNPIRYTDPSGHYEIEEDPGDFDKLYIKYNFLKKYAWNPLPKVEDIITGANFPKKPDNINWEEWQLTVKSRTNEYYVRYREELFFTGNSQYIDSSGMINDQVLISLVISSEFGFLKQTDPGSYQDHLGAVSKQYDGNSYVTSGPPICRGGCPSIEAQLVWLQAWHAMRNGRAFLTSFGPNSLTDPTVRWTVFLSDAAIVMRGPFGSYSSFGQNEDGVTILRR